MDENVEVIDLTESDEEESPFMTGEDASTLQKMSGGGYSMYRTPTAAAKDPEIPNQIAVKLEMASDFSLGENVTVAHVTPDLTGRKRNHEELEEIEEHPKTKIKTDPHENIKPDVPFYDTSFLAHPGASINEEEQVPISPFVFPGKMTTMEKWIAHRRKAELMREKKKEEARLKELKERSRHCFILCK